MNFYNREYPNFNFLVSKNDIMLFFIVRFFVTFFSEKLFT